MPEQGTTNSRLAQRVTALERRMEVALGISVSDGADGADGADGSALNSQVLLLLDSLIARVEFLEQIHKIRRRRGLIPDTGIRAALGR
jgi:hypothetical protein